MRKNQVYMTIYASLVTAMFLGTPGAALGLSGDTGPAGMVDDPAADVYPLEGHILYAFIPEDEECPAELVETPSGHNIWTADDQYMLIDGTYITYDQFVWVWEGEVRDCVPVAGFLLFIVVEEAMGVGINGPDALV